MELYAFQKVLSIILSTGFKVSTITTDRHHAIRKFMKQNFKEINHQLKNTIVAKAKYAKYSMLGGWAKFIINYFWWSSVTCLEDSVMLEE